MNIIEAIKNPGPHRMIRLNSKEKPYLGCGWIEVPINDNILRRPLFQEDINMIGRGISYIPHKEELLSDEWEAMEWIL